MRLTVEVSERLARLIKLSAVMSGQTISDWLTKAAIDRMKSADNGLSEAERQVLWDYNKTQKAARDGEPEERT